MTAQSSSKGCFVTYLKYRLGLLKINFVMCCILNVLGLPLYAAAANVGFGGGVSEFAMTARVFSMMIIASLPAIAMFNAIASFDYYHKKDLTDTIGVLPLTHRQRFFADLLAGYAVNVAPIIPCGIFCVIALGNTQGKLVFFHHISIDCSFKMASVGAIIVMTLLVIITFAYLLTVLINICCGKIFHTVIFSLFAMAVLPLLSGGLVRSFANGVVGIGSSEYFLRGAEFFPPIGLLYDLFFAMGIAFQTSFYVEDSVRAGELFAVSKPVHIAVYVLLAAGLTAGAYLLAKRRLAENTGSAFAVKPAFNIISAGITAGATIAVLALCYNVTKNYIIVAAAAGAVTFLVTLLLNPRRKKALLRSLIIGAAAIASMLAVWLVLDKSGSFGLRYLPKNPDKIEYLNIDYTYTITDKADIETYITLLNDQLRNNPSDMQYEEKVRLEKGFYVDVKTADGKTNERLYGGATTGRKIFSHLDGYVDYFFDELESTHKDCQCDIMSKNVNIHIPAEKTKEFIAILREEASEKHSPDAPEFAKAVFSGYGNRTFIIEQSYTRTIAFLDTLNENVEIDPETVYLSINYTIIQENWERLSVNIPYKDRNDERVKELVQLLKNGRGTRDGDFDVYSSCVVGLGDVTEENRDRVLEIMVQLASEIIDG